MRRARSDGRDVAVRKERFPGRGRVGVRARELAGRVVAPGEDGAARVETERVGATAGELGDRRWEARDDPGDEGRCLGAVAKAAAETHAEGGYARHGVMEKRGTGIWWASSGQGRGARSSGRPGSTRSRGITPWVDDISWMFFKYSVEKWV